MTAGQDGPARGSGSRSELLVPLLIFVVLAALPAAFAGGWLALARIDPALALPFIPFAALATAPWLAQGRRGWLVPPLVLVAGLALAALALGARFDPAQMLLLLTGGAASLALVQWAVRRAAGRAWRIAALGLVPALLCGWSVARALDWAYMVPPANTPGGLAYLSSVPLAGPPAASIADVIARPAVPGTVAAMLSRQHRLRPLDALSPASLAPHGTLLLVHPRALAPAELVALDDWVRRGGRTLMLADGLYAGHLPWPLGDARNPPITSLLTPLLDHWGITLAAPPTPQIADVTLDGVRVRMLAPGRFTRWPANCGPAADPVMLRCRIGAGRVTLIADADWIDTDLWAGGGGRLAAAGSIDWLTAELARLDRRPLARAWLRPVWVGENRGH